MLVKLSSSKLLLNNNTIKPEKTNLSIIKYCFKRKNFIVPAKRILNSYIGYDGNLCEKAFFPSPSNVVLECFTILIKILLWK